MDRRSALKAALGYCGGTACSGVLGSLAVGCDSRGSSEQRSDNGGPGGGGAPGRKPSFESTLLSLEQVLTLEDLTEQLIPETDTPGAKQAGVAEQIEVQLREVLEPADVEVFTQGLDAVSARAKMQHQKLFYELDAAGQASFFSQMVAAVQKTTQAGLKTPFFSSLRKLTIHAFCESKLGATRVLQYESVPGAYKACVPLESIGRAWATR